MGRCLIAVVLLLGGVFSPAVGMRAAAAVPQTTASTYSAPVFAYYYIWFDPASWNRAKTDLPVLGKYSSDDPKVMRQQIVWAKRAGIDGFIVSWKHTPVLDRRLGQLISIAESEHFSLEVIYEGLDFSRAPQPVVRVAGDFQYFAKTFAPRAPFRRLAKPILIWSGTWMYSPTDIAKVTQLIRPQVSVLASEKNVTGYLRIAGSVDGDAYYWSSVNPDTNSGYLEKLVDLSNTVHADGGIWIAPAAAGFDARKIGGTTIVDRQNGALFEREIASAGASAPDILGVISWNEFSENSQIEPSLNFGFEYLQVLASSLGRLTSFPGDAVPSDSTDSSSPGNGFPTGLVVAPIVAALSLIAMVAIGVRNRRRTALARARRRHRKPSRRRAGRRGVRSGGRGSKPESSLTESL